MIDPQLADVIRRSQQPAPPQDGFEPESAPGFRPDGTPWTEEEVEAFWGLLREHAARWPELQASAAQPQAAERPDPTA